ncbi:MAG: DL-endopeptidase inhibitor IseA family protein, partial [Syntrophomonas sp.]
MIGCSNRVMVLTFFLGLILLIGGCNSDSKENAASKAAPISLSDQEILDLLSKAEQIPYDIQAMRDESDKIVEDDKGNCYIQLPASLDAEEKIHKLYTPYWTEEAINKFMQPYSVVKGKYCSTMGDWGE